MLLKTIAKLSFTLSLLFLFFQQADAQRFRAGVVGGFNASQILGDNIGGYNKLGLQGGLRAVTVLADRYDVSLELLYSQRGSYSKDGNHICWDGTQNMNLQYVEVPVVFNYKDWLVEGDGGDEYYRVQVSGGFSYGRLINVTSRGSCHDDLVDQFNENDFSFTTGLEYFTRPNFSLGVRWSKSFNLLFKHQDNTLGRNSLRGFFLSFRGVYMF